MPPPTILLIEDDEFIIDIYSKILLQKGYQIKIARNGQEGIKMAQEEKPSLILLDILLPVCDGWETLAHIKKDHILQNIPVFMLTNIGDEKSIKRAKAEGVKEYLIKAYTTSEELLDKVMHYLSK